MKIQAKKLALSAISALSMSIFAVTSPVMAQELIPMDYTNSSTSAGVEISLRVTGEAPEVEIVKPYDGQVLVGKKFPAVVNYGQATQLQYELIYVHDNGTRESFNLPDKVVSTSGPASGTDSFTINVNNYTGEYGNYILKAIANGNGSTEDSVAITLIAFDFIVKGYEEGTKNPIITILESPGVYKALVQIFDDEGNAIFESPEEVILNEGTTTDATLPLARYGVPEGKYTIVATPYDEQGNIVDNNRAREIYYAPAEAPEVPNTGGFFGALGLSRQDLISTGLALLFVAGFFGILIIAKKSRDQKRR
jgi:hypothetical protein